MVICTAPSPSISGLRLVDRDGWSIFFWLFRTMPVLKAVPITNSHGLRVKPGMTKGRSGASLRNRDLFTRGHFPSKAEAAPLHRREGSVPYDICL